MGTGPVPPGLTEAFLGGAREASLRKRQPQAHLADWRPGQHVRAKILEGCSTKGNLPRPGLRESVLPSLPASRETRLCYVKLACFGLSLGWAEAAAGRSRGWSRCPEGGMGVPASGSVVRMSMAAVGACLLF